MSGIEWLGRATAPVRRLRIVQKLVVGYVVLIIIPFVAFSVAFYLELYEQVLAEYRATNDIFVEQAVSSLQAEFARIEAITPLFQNNRQLTWYMDHRYLQNWEMIYNYQRSISPIFSFIYSSVPAVERVVVYKYDSNVLELGSHIVDADRYDGPISISDLQTLRYSEGLWYAEPSESSEYPSMTYTVKLYDELYARELGLLQITVNDRAFQSIRASFSRSPETWMLMWDPARGAIYGEHISEGATEGIVAIASREAAGNARSEFTPDRRSLVRVVPIPRLGMAMASVSGVDALSNMTTRGGWSLAVAVLLLTVPTLVYFAIASSVAQRLLHFTRHLKDVDHPTLVQYTNEPGSDEIGFLIRAYNSMVERLTEVMREAHRAELTQKDAEIKMLQAQIKPHFLYNTLETIRMLAHVKHETQIAEMASSLGRLLRYSLANENRRTTIADELGSVHDYVELHRIRMGRRLDYHLDVPENLTSVEVPRFFLQPIVENSILHGIGKLRRDGIITLSIRKERGLIHVVVSDNGKGIEPERLREIQAELALTHAEPDHVIGIGLRFVNQRLKTSFGHAARMTIQSTECAGTTVEMWFSPEVVDDEFQVVDRR